MPKRVALAVALLKSDVIENLGMIKLDNDPVEGLISKVAERMPYSHHQISDDVTSWVKRGYLKYTAKNGHLLWYWT